MLVLFNFVWPLPLMRPYRPSGLSVMASQLGSMLFLFDNNFKILVSFQLTIMCWSTSRKHRVWGWYEPLWKENGIYFTIRIRYEEFPKLGISLQENPAGRWLRRRRSDAKPPWSVGFECNSHDQSARTPHPPFHRQSPFLDSWYPLCLNWGGSL